MRARSVIALTLASVLGTVLVSTGPAAAAGKSDVAKVRAMTAKYHNVAAAEADGWQRASECVPGMGYHYVNPAYAFAASELPTALLYIPSGDRLRLVAVEWVVFDADQDMELDESWSRFGQTFHGPMSHGIPIHRELHVWVWQGNPDGLFAQTNPNVVCP